MGHAALALFWLSSAACPQFADSEGLGKLVQSIEGNAKRYQHLFAEVADTIMPRATEAAEADVADILAQHVSSL